MHHGCHRTALLPPRPHIHDAGQGGTPALPYAGCRPVWPLNGTPCSGRVISTSPKARPCSGTKETARERLAPRSAKATNTGVGDAGVGDGVLRLRPRRGRVIRGRVRLTPFCHRNLRFCSGFVDPRRQPEGSRRPARASGAGAESKQDARRGTRRRHRRANGRLAAHP